MHTGINNDMKYEKLVELYEAMDSTTKMIRKNSHF
jgi:hypothetical protein